MSESGHCDDIREASDTPYRKYCTNGSHTPVGKGDYLVQWRARPGHRPPGLDPAVDLPNTLRVREVTFRVTQPGFRTKAVTLVTTLLDATHYPAEALATLYGKRWAMEMLRTKTPSRVQAEVAMFLLGYNLIRAVMHDAAQTTRVALSRLSFTSAVVRVRLWCARCPRPDALREWLVGYQPLLHDLARDVNPHRPGWVEPRVVKRRPKPFPRMQQPRQVLRSVLLRA